MRTVLSCVPARRLGRQAGRRSDGCRDDRPDRRSLESETPMSAGAVVLVGCGQMGAAMLRGWLASEAAAHFEVIEPAGAPAALAASPRVSAHRSPDELAGGLAPDAVVFAIKPQVANDVVPAYRR